MKKLKYSIQLILYIAVIMFATSCEDNLNDPAENKSFTEGTDYTISEDMDLPLLGLYAGFNDKGWPNNPLMAVRGDDVNAGGLGDQQDFAETDKFNYNKDFWMYNAVWEDEYADVFTSYSAIEQIQLYQEFTSNKALGDQYIAEAKTIRAWLLFNLSRVWGGIFIPENSDPSNLLVASLTSKADVMQFISDQMDEAIPLLPDMRPNERTDIPGGVTKYTALAIKALANLEMENYQKVADATSQIISNGGFSLEPDFYELFKIGGKLNSENLLEMQYSDFGMGAGDNKSYLFAFFGPQGWTPKVTGAGDGWGFWEPSMKYIKFMLDRNETVRLETSVLFTDRGIAEIEKDPNYATLPSWISNTTRSGDQINDYARAMFASGKHYLPSDELTPGRTDYGTNKNFTCIRYAEILLMHAEALTQGASSSVMSADDAVNEVRARAGLAPLTGVTNEQVMDEKFAELAMEWGTRFYDMVRLGKYDELSYEGRTFSADLTYLPYPQNQVDLLPALQGNN
ncbi:RagB/SusD family nutrient uptake outer membrane protein [Ancylomarina longa]|uniref:RagB/SusD family nutrient uptake outer membrane protein n=1 Tax=Ancylomarina longa TaxID=2487017 RepID=A0A434AUW7_9BACT|nr:RagB/SusD family nutrient uptake outer membrane protein [Ancylomarina longa]RUT78264.1 RagB/SusD family nutrient uptake outer membrane protein [Ancylomarina longa]